MKIVFLDAKTIGEDIDLSRFDQLGEVVKYPFSTSEEVPERVKDADVLIINKITINKQTIHTAEHLKLICVTATGTDVLDKKYLEKRGIAWRNVADYSTESVAQDVYKRQVDISAPVGTNRIRFHSPFFTFGRI